MIMITCFVGQDAPNRSVETCVSVEIHSVKSKKTSLGRSLQENTSNLVNFYFFLLFAIKKDTKKLQLLLSSSSSSSSLFI